VQRDLRRLADSRFDLIVVGAGFYGAMAAWDATLRGLSVALIDKGDFGGATSFNNLKTLHGGLRSLQSLNLTQMRLFIRERRALARVAPHLVQPLPFIVPTYRYPTSSALAMRVALRINDAVSHDRHDGVDPALRLPGGRIVSRDECLRMNPLIDSAGVTGGAVWHDYQMHNTDRMTLSFVTSAAGKGAVAANYASAEGLLRDGGRVAGVRVRDMLCGDTFDVRATSVLNATGPWAAAFLEQTLHAQSTTPAPRLSRAMNLVIGRVTVTQGCGGRAAGRFLFLAPWRHVTLVGTSHDVHTGGADALAVSRPDLDAFLADVRAAFPHANLSASDVRLVHRGLLPMVSSRGHHVKLLRESAVVDHARDNAPGLVSMFGVRYTTARATAERAVDTIFRARGDRNPPACRTAETPIAGGAIPDKEKFLRKVTSRDTNASREVLRRLALTYGTEHAAVLQLLHEDSTLAAPLGRECAVTGAEILYATRHEAAVHLTDALIRRTEAGSAGHPGTDAIERAAVLMAREHAWDPQKLSAEVANVEAFYRLPS
jgi:glycerol-3-phosphate dehydrogenase